MTKSPTKDVSYELYLGVVSELLPEDELYAQLAEEAAELSQAASKMARIIRGKNPTPVGKTEAQENLFEEFADVQVCKDAIFGQNDIGRAASEAKVEDISREKALRWMKRVLNGNYGFDRAEREDKEN